MTAVCVIEPEVAVMVTCDAPVGVLGVLGKLVPVQLTRSPVNPSSDSLAKLFASYLRGAEESVLGSVLVELTVLLAVARQQTAQVLNEAAAL